MRASSSRRREDQPAERARIVVAADAENAPVSEPLVIAIRDEEDPDDSHRRHPAQRGYRRDAPLREDGGRHGGEYVLVEVVVEPRGAVAAAHVHPYQTESFEILEGEVGFKVDGKTILARAGETLSVEPGTAHKFWNAGDTDARFRTEVRPALEFESLIETMFALANDGKTNRKGLPSPLRLAVIAKAHFDVVRLPFPPAWVQRLGLAMGAPLGRMLGFRPTYEAA
jgi:quercetin dioxygenase-like cupin family protein